MMVIPKNDPGCRPMSMLNLAGFLARSEVNGPGIRAVIWVRGCSRRCKGCFNEEFQSCSPATLVSVDELAETILAIPGIDGVTLSGGEPFEQAGPLAELGERLRRDRLTIVTYTGYTAQELAGEDNTAWPALLAVTDLLVAGPYIEALARPDPLKGSSNQEAIPVGTRLLVPQKGEHPHHARSRTEFTITPDGTITTTGFPVPALIEQLASRCRGA